MEATRTPKHQFLKDPQCAKYQQTSFFIVTAVKTSNPTELILFVCRNSVVLDMTAETVGVKCIFYISKALISSLIL
jgi:hypothetical protein